MDAALHGVAALTGSPEVIAGEGDRLDAARAAQGDIPAFERLYRKHAPRIHTLARRMMGPDHADEMAQDVFIRVWEKLGTFRGESAFGTWLYRLALNLIFERRAALGVRRGREQTGEEAFSHLSTQPASSDLGMDFEAAISKLPDGAREIFVLHDIEGYKHREIARMLHISSGTSKGQLHRARMILREHLGHWMGHHDERPVD